MKKLNKFFAVLVALAMMATLCVSMAFAADEVPTGTDKTAKMVKYLQAGDGVEVPKGMTFNFTLTPLAGNPAEVGTVEVAIPFSGMTKDANGDYIGSKTIEEIFTGVTFAKAGEYKFTADEVATTGWTAAEGETLVEDQDTFEVHLYVKNTENGTAIDKVTVSDGTDKQDPTEIKEKADDGQDENGKNIGFSFTNTFKKDLSDDNDNDASGLIDLEKKVEGTYADKTYKFDFDLAYELPAANESDVYYKVLPKGTTDASGITAVKATGSPINVKLADGEKLIITKAPQGIKWSTTENLSKATDLQNHEKYQATVDKYDAGASEPGADHSTTQQTLSEKDAVKYTNTLEDTDVTPTGILINNLPYIALALVAIGGLVAYVVVRRRQDDEA